MQWEGQTHNVEDVTSQTTRIYMPTNDVVLVAVCAERASATLADAAYQHCKTDGEQWFASAAEANTHRRLVLPYVPDMVFG